jgi:DMSO reductase anchor subunit
MHPAYSVILLTTLIGVGQGFFIALYATELGVDIDWLAAPPQSFFAFGSLIAALFAIAGLAASFFHLGRPERAWRAAAMWRTSWLSREVIALPVFIALTLLYGAMHYFGYAGTTLLGAVGVVACITLFICTGMIYRAIRFLQEWATPLTLSNFMLLGTASGYTWAAAYSLASAPELTAIYAKWAIVFTLLALCSRISTLVRNARIRLRSTVQTAIGVKHPKIAQKAQGFIGSSFNTREFFHGRPIAFVRAVKWTFLVLVFAVPVALLAVAVLKSAPAFVIAAFVAQYAGLLAERWFFFAEARHPQNLYYQAMS